MILNRNESSRNILFLTGTRADFGKLKSLILACREIPEFDVRVFATGMHMHQRYGQTINEIRKSGITQEEIFPYINFTDESRMDLSLANTIQGLSNYVQESKPDLLVVHGDRGEALAGAIVGALNNILVAHIEGGELSGTIDEVIRHAVSKLSHRHFVANDEAKKRLLQLGEAEDSIYTIGSPDVDVMLSDRLPDLDEALEHYGLPFRDYAIVAYHPVTTALDETAEIARALVDALLETPFNYIVIEPNSDTGSRLIEQEYRRLEGDERIRIFPSIRFEYFLTLMKHSRAIIGNSSAGIREAPYFGTPSLDLGSRQSGRARDSEILHLSLAELDRFQLVVEQAWNKGARPALQIYGDGKSTERFVSVVTNDAFWEPNVQKRFFDLD